MTFPPPRSRGFVVAITLGLALAGAQLSAHVAPSVDDNNRYLKVTPLGDRIRLAYTVFYGEVPGAAERRTIDANGDGQIAFGVKIAAAVAGALEVELDGAVTPMKWEVVDVGMGTPTVAAGSFSVDMVAYLCLAQARGDHRVNIRDRFRIARPGETEVKVEDSPGIRIEHARVGAAEDPSFDYRFAGPGGPLSDDGLDLQFTAGPKSEVSGTCASAVRTASPSGSRSPALLIVLIGIGALVLAGAIWGALKYFRT